MVLDAPDATSDEPGVTALAAWVGSKPAPAATAVERLSARFDPRMPEVEIATAWRTLESLRDVPGEEIVGDLFEQLARLREVVQDQPSSIEARMAAVVALVLVSDRRGELTPEEQRRLRGYVDWLLDNAPTTHAQREFWSQIQARLR